MKNIIKTFTLIVAFVISAGISYAQGDFISAKDYSKIAKDKNTITVSTQKEKNYKSSHITNSVHLNHKDLYKSSGPEGILKSPAEIAKILGALGISETKTIVIYDDGKNKYSTRVYWILKYLGAPKVKLLHKDMGAFRSARIPLTKSVTKPKAATFKPKVNSSIATNFDFVNKNLSNSKVAIIDVRHITEFNGTSTDPVSKGHIPGAKNIEWKKVENEKGALLPNSELTKLFTDNGITKDKTIILYCATSVRAGIVYVALKNLGYTNVKIYDGAYNEWVAKGGKLEK